MRAAKYLKAFFLSTQQRIIPAKQFVLTGKAATYTNNNNMHQNFWHSFRKSSWFLRLDILDATACTVAPVSYKEFMERFSWQKK